MQNELLNFIKEHNLFTAEEKILLTVSGGIDSMAMLHLFSTCNFKIAIAHCNFGLRGSESDGDEELVTRTAQKLKVPIHINRFDTLHYADEKGISIQMAARELRYKWFHQLIKENNYTRIATAHNSNDVAETILINLTRGTGIHGMTGISIKNGNIIRPLLFASRNEIERYVSLHKISYREDSSNSQTKYIRNEIRHHIIPLFEKLNPSFQKSLNNTASILKDAEAVYTKHIDQLRSLVITENKNLIRIDIAALQSHSVSAPQVFEILSPYNFSYDTAEKMLEAINAQSGATFYSETHKLVKDRKSFILYPLVRTGEEIFTINRNDEIFDGLIKLKLTKHKADEDFVLKRNREVGTFDADKLTYPLTLRRWKKGDYFYPYGMRGRKKLSDYFIDQKISIPEKENTWLLCSGNNIIWIVNHRTDNRFCITKSTRNILQIELMN